MDDAITCKIRKHGTPLFVYDAEKIRENYRELMCAFPYENKRVLYASMANYQPFIFGILKDIGCDFHVQSVNAFDYVSGHGIPKERISFTSCGTSKDDMKRLRLEGVQVNFESLPEIENYGKAAKGGKSAVITHGIRIFTADLGIIEGATNGSYQSDVGICPEDMEEAVKISRKLGIKIGGVHGYLASNVSDSKCFWLYSNYVTEMASMLGDSLEYVNFGSGFSLGLDLKEVGVYYSESMRKLSGKAGRSIRMEIEPGRRLVGSAGTLLTKVTDVKKLRDGKVRLCVDAGFGEFARPYIYGCEGRGRHEIASIEGDFPEGLYDIRSATVLQTDVLGFDRRLPDVKEGDILMVMDAGAYAMASGFPNPKPRAKHMLL